MFASLVISGSHSGSSMRRLLRCGSLLACVFAVISCGPQKPVVTTAQTGTDVNGDRKADLVAVSRTNGDMGEEPRGLLLFPGSVTSYTLTSVARASTYSSGTWAARVGEINGDAFSDLIVGQDLENGSYDVRVLEGSATSVNQVGRLPNANPDDGTTGSCFGIGAGDINGDQAQDVVIIRHHSTLAIHFGGNGLRSVPDRTRVFAADEPILNAWRIGDVNRDGSNEIALLQRTATMPNGVLRVYRGSLMGFEGAPMFELPITTAPAEDADVNHDGFADLVVGGVGDAASCVNVFYGGMDGLRANRSSVSTCAPRDGGVFGPSQVLAPGDMDADGFDDVIVFDPGIAIAGACPTSNTQLAYRIRFFHGGASGLEPRDNTVVDGPVDNGCGYGQNITFAGDVNADGYDDIVVGAPGFGSANPLEDGPGKLHVYHGGGGGINATRVRHIDGPPGTRWGLGRFAR